MKQFLATCLLGLGGLAACGSGTNAAGPDAASAVVVAGTALDAGTGAALADVKVTGPGGTEAISASDGRFRLTGLHLGDEGIVRGELPDGRSAEVPLRPLSRERLEIVLHMRRPR